MLLYGAVHNELSEYFVSGQIMLADCHRSRNVTWLQSQFLWLATPAVAVFKRCSDRVQIDFCWSCPPCMQTEKIFSRVGPISAFYGIVAWLAEMLLEIMLMIDSHDTASEGISLISLSTSLIGQQLLRTPKRHHEPGPQFFVKTKRANTQTKTDLVFLGNYIELSNYPFPSFTYSSPLLFQQRSYR